MIKYVNNHEHQFHIIVITLSTFILLKFQLIIVFRKSISADTFHP